MNDFGNFLSEAFLAGTCAGVFGMFGEDLLELFWHDESEVFEIILKSLIGLIEPELIEIKNGCLFGV